MIDEKGLFFIIGILVIGLSIVFEVETKILVLALGIVIALFYSYIDLTKTDI
jgi:hypothetical protein